MSYLLQEDGVSRIILEDGSGFILLDDGLTATSLLRFRLHACWLIGFVLAGLL